MAMSDLCGLLIQQWFNICINPLFENADLPILASAFQFLTAGVPRVVFSKITCLITVYATLERCLCIAFPLHIKQMITPRRTALVMVCIYSLTVLSISPLYYRTSISWTLYQDRNRTILGLVFNTGSEMLTQIVYILQAILNFVSFVTVVILTAVLIRKLGQKSTWRKSANVSLDKSESMSNRDRKTVTMITMIASILIVCYTPSFMLFIVTFIEPQFSVAGKYTNLFFALWSFGILFETVNSSVNIFLYIKMSTKYRNTFMQLAPCMDKQTSHSELKQQ